MKKNSNFKKIVFVLVFVLLFLLITPNKTYSQISIEYRMPNFSAFMGGFDSLIIDEYIPIAALRRLINGDKNPPNHSPNPSPNPSGGGGGTNPTGTGSGPIDLCLNIDGIQETIPEGLEDVGGRICLVAQTFGVFCRPHLNPIEPGNTVTFIASPFNQEEGEEIEYVWKTTDGSHLKTDVTRDDSFYQKTYSSPGIYQVLVTGTDSAGTSFTRTCAVTVSAGDSGITGLIPEANLSITGSPTNSTCTVQWTTANVIECYLAEAAGHNHQVEDYEAGSEDVYPGSYILRCISKNSDAALVESDWVKCWENFNIREM
jgi:hypothetical protein